MQPNPKSSLAVDFTQGEEGYKSIFKRSPIISNASAGWDNSGIAIAYDRQPPFEMPKTVAKQHCIGILTDIPPLSVLTERKIDGRLKQEQNVRGDCIIVPANTSHQATWEYEGSALTIAIDPLVFAQSIYEVVDPDQIELLPQFATPDPLISQIGLALKSSLTMHSKSSRLYAESLVNTLIVHLLEHYSVPCNPFKSVTGKLPQYKLQQIIDYISAYLDRDLSIRELSNVVQMSPHYFSRLFKITTGITPHQYIIRCRIERAKNLLQQNQLSIANIAKEVGFADQSHLHRHFKRLVGVTPKSYLREFGK